MSGIYLRVGVYRGALRHEVACDLVTLAERTGVVVQTTFNGTRVLARPGDDPAELARAISAALDSRGPVRLAALPIARREEAA